MTRFQRGDQEFGILPAMTLTAELRDILGHDRVLTEPLERWVYGVDSGVVRGEALLVAFPETTAEVANLAVVDASGQQFQEPTIRLIAGGDYD